MKEGQDEPSVSMEFVDRAVASEHRLALAEITRVKEVLEERLRGMDKATDSQVQEMQRRLLDLNHAHAEKLVDMERKLPRETYEIFERSTNMWREEVNKQLSNAQGRTAAYVSVLGLAFILVQIALKFWGK